MGLTRYGQMSKVMGIPPTIIPHLLNNFTAKQVISETRERYVMNSNHKVKLINYIFVAHLILSNYSMKLSQLMKDLSLDIKTTRTHAIKIGCSVIGGGKSFRGRNSFDVQPDYDVYSIPEMTASLNAPISFTDTSVRSRRN